MPPMIERVARILAARHFRRQVYGSRWTEAEYVETYWRDWTDDAQAVFEALQRPTDDVLAALDRVPGGWGLGAWQAGLDAALSEGERM